MNFSNSSFVPDFLNNFLIEFLEFEIIFVGFGYFLHFDPFFHGFNDLNFLFVDGLKSMFFFLEFGADLINPIIPLSEGDF